MVCLVLMVDMQLGLHSVNVNALQDSQAQIVKYVLQVLVRLPVKMVELQFQMLMLLNNASVTVLQDIKETTVKF